MNEEQFQAILDQPHIVYWFNQRNVVAHPEAVSEDERQLAHSRARRL